MTSNFHSNNKLINCFHLFIIHMNCRVKLIFCLVLDIFPMIFDGVKLMVNKGLNNHFQVTHNIYLSSVTPAGYR